MATRTVQEPTRTVQELRSFNRFYTNLIGALDYSRHLHTPYTLTEARVLYELLHAPRTDAADLRTALSVDAGQLSRMLARFEQRGLVTRAASESDARRVRVQLTEEGRQAARLLEERSQQAVASLLEGLGDAEREKLSRSLATARGILEDAASAGSARGRARPAGRRNEGAGETAEDAAGADASARDDDSVRDGASARDARHGEDARHTPDAQSAAAPDDVSRSAERVRLRAPAPGDFGWIVERNAAVYAAEFGWDATYEALVARIVAEFAAGHDPGREAAWIAELDGRRAGCVMCVQEEGAPDTARLRLLLVDPPARGHGLGDRLVAECTGFARAAGYRELVLWTNDVLEAARRVYRRAGFELVRESRHHSFGHELTGQDWRLVL